MLKHTFFKVALTKATSFERALINIHYAELEDKYNSVTATARKLWQEGRITMGMFRKATMPAWKQFRSELKQRIKGVIGKHL